MFNCIRSMRNRARQYLGARPRPGSRLQAPGSRLRAPTFPLSPSLPNLRMNPSSQYYHNQAKSSTRMQSGGGWVFLLTYEHIRRYRICPVSVLLDLELMTRRQEPALLDLRTSRRGLLLPKLIPSFTRGQYMFVLTFRDRPLIIGSLLAISGHNHYDISKHR